MLLERQFHADGLEGVALPSRVVFSTLIAGLTNCMRFDITPLLGVGPVLLGMPRADVRAVMGETPDEFFKAEGAHHATDSYYDSAFQVSYSDEPPVVNFVEVFGGGGVEIFLEGMDVFATDAATVIAKVTERHAFDEHDPELGYTYVFPELELAFWRPSIPNDEFDEGRFFSTVAIGLRGYFARHDE